MRELSPEERAMLREMGIQWPARVPDAVKQVMPATPAVQAPVTPAAPALPVQALADRGDEGDREVSPPQVAVAGLDWNGLQADVAACQRCGLCRTRRRTVFGVGHAAADWMVVGEAPGEQEDRAGEPFVGPAGQLLDRMLASIGLSRDESAAPAERVFITNTVKCRPPQNRNPQPEELAACAPVLQRQIELVRPRLLLAMGRFAAQQLLATEEPIGRLRGRVHQLSQPGGGPGLPVVVTYHPAYLLRNPADKAKAWDDLCLAVETMEGLGFRTSSAA